MAANKPFSHKAFIPERVNAQLSKWYDMDSEVLGTGGFGVVHKATDRSTGRVVAIKKVLGMNESTAAKYMREANIMQELDHPGICKIYEVYQDGDVLYFVLEYLEGGELFDKIIEEKMSEEAVADIVKQVACALKYAHSCGMAHRDLKPENICFCNRTSSQVKVIDWGLSSDFHKGSMKSSVGSPTYTGPEVHSAQGEEIYTSACDLWSLGVLTYVMLSGKPPFWGNPQTQMRKMQQEEYPIKSGDWLRVSESAKDFIRRLLKADPRERMTIDQVLSHTFLTHAPSDKVEKPQMQQVLSNIVSFSSAPRFFSLLVASAARQLDHSNVKSIRQVFNELDANHDGVLDLQEVQAAFVATFGEDSQEVRQIEHIFNKLDLDGRQRLTYTEFCAAAMGEDDRLQEQVLRLAFALTCTSNVFDIKSGTGRISEDEIEKLLARADGRGRGVSRAPFA